MGIPDFPRGAPEGRDISGGVPVDPGDAAAETAHHAALMDAAEQFYDTHARAGYAGPGSLPDIVCNTGADDVAGA